MAIAVLAVPGMLYNNLNNNGLVVSQSQALTCVSPNSLDNTCIISGNVGCQASATYCTLSGSTISFLSHTSVFTNLLSGNIFGLFTGLTNQGSAPIHGPWDLIGGTNVAEIRANCVIDDAGGKGLTQWQFQTHYCTQANSDTSNMTKANANTWVEWNGKLASKTDQNLAFYLLKGNATATFGCNWQFQLNYTIGGKSTGFTWYGCSFSQGNTNVQTDRTWAWWVAVPNEFGKLNVANKFASGANCNGANCYHVNVQVALVKWDTDICATTSNANGLNQQNSNANLPFHSTECDQFAQSLNNAVQTANSNSLSFGLLSPIILFLIGLILLFISLGIGIGWGGSVLGSGVQGSVQENEEGSKFAQVLGLGLVVWVPFYSEFSTWFTSGLLPYGLDGSLGIISLLLTGLFWFGIFWRAQSLD